MKQRFALLKTMSFVCLISAQSLLAQDGPDPSQISIRNLQYNGSACPQNSVSYNLSQDGQAFTLLFSQFVLQGSAPTANVSSGCDLILNLQVPNGWSYSLFSLDYRGFADLQTGSRVQTRAIYAFDGQQEVQIGTGSLSGPYQDDFFLRNITPVQSLSYSNCEGQVRPLRLSTKFNLRGTGLLEVDSFDGQLVHQYGIAWKRCQPRPVNVYRIPSQLTCFYKAFKGNNTIHGMIEYDANLNNATRR